MQIALTPENFNEQLNTSTNNDSINYTSDDGFIENEIPPSDLQIEGEIRKNEIFISRKMRWFIFSVFLSLQITMNLDHGTVPAATDEIRKDLKIDDNVLGLFASLVFVGNLIGKIYFIYILNSFIRFNYVLKHNKQISQKTSFNYIFIT